MKTKKDCPSCGYTSLETTNFSSRLKVWTCSNCFFSSQSDPDNRDHDEYEDIPLNRRKTEREIAEKIRKELLPKQKIKIRLVKKIGREEYGRTEFEEDKGEFWKSPVKPILISAINFRKSKKYPYPRKNFVDSVVHELAHASDDVRFHPNFDPDSKEFQKGCVECGEEHFGAGHDRIWHDKYLAYKGRITKVLYIKKYLKGKK